MTYIEKLKDPRWQRKRLEILNRDDFTCQMCDDKETMLHVHHTYYENGLEPWEYPNESLRTLCSNCHKYETIDLKEASQELILILKKRGMYSCDIRSLSMAFESCPIEIDQIYEIFFNFLIYPHVSGRVISLYDEIRLERKNSFKNISIDSPFNAMTKKSNKDGENA